MEVRYRGDGIVYYKGISYSCSLYVNEELGGVLINVYTNDPTSSFIEVPIEMDYLFGELSTGFQFTLYKVARSNTHHDFSRSRTTFVYEASRIMYGIGGNDKQIKTFHQAHYRISDIIWWGQKSVYEIKEDHSLVVSGTKESLLYENDCCRIVYKVNGSLLPYVTQDLYNESIHLKQYVTIEISSKAPQTIDFFDRTFIKVKRLIEIAVLDKLNIEKLQLFSQEYYHIHNSTRSELPIDIYGNDIICSEKVNDRKKDKFKSVLLSQLIDNKSFDLFFRQYNILEPIVELYLDTFYYHFSDRRIFLNLVQALEMYHSRYVTNSLEEYKRRVSNLVSIVDHATREQIKKWMLGNSTKFITLESRLADLVYAEHKIFFDTGRISRDLFPESIAQTRNYYIHFDESLKEKGKVLDESEIGFYNIALITILEYYILGKIGFDSDSIEFHRFLKERWGKTSEMLQIRSLSEDRHKDE